MRRRQAPVAPNQQPGRHTGVGCPFSSPSQPLLWTPLGSSCFLTRPHPLHIDLPPHSPQARGEECACVVFAPHTRLAAASECPHRHRGPSNRSFETRTQQQQQQHAAHTQGACGPDGAGRGGHGREGRLGTSCVCVCLHVWRVLGSSELIRLVDSVGGQEGPPGRLSMQV